MCEQGLMTRGQAAERQQALAAQNEALQDALIDYEQAKADAVAAASALGGPVGDAIGATIEVANAAVDVSQGQYGEAAMRGGSAAGGHLIGKGLQALKGADDVVETAVEQTARSVPNPHGKLGGPAHQTKVQEVFDDIEVRGLIPQTEVPIRTVNGQKQTRYMDVVARQGPDGPIVEVHQIGRGLESNPLVPVARERAALRDIRYSPEVRGAHRFFHPYNTTALNGL